MPIEHFKIINDDGTTNEAEYNRCITFLQEYTQGTLKIYQQMTWANPFEVDLSQPLSAYTILKNILLLEENRLLTPTAMNNIKKLFKGLLSRYAGTIHTYGDFLENSANFTDGPGYMYDVLTKDATAVSKEEVSDTLDIYYLNDENHTVIEFNDKEFKNKDNVTPDTNVPSYTLSETTISGNYSGPTTYFGNLGGVYSDFQRITGQYVGSSTLFYYSYCNDQMYTTGINSYEDSRIGGIVNFNHGMTVYDKTMPARGIELARVGELQSAVENPYTIYGYIPPEEINPTVNYLGPTFWTAADETEWLI